MPPKNAPTVMATTSTIMVSRIVSCRVGHTAFLSSEITSLNRLSLPLPLEAAIARAGLLLGIGLLGLPMRSMGPAARAELLEFQALRVIPPVLGGGIAPLLALGTCQVNHLTYGSLLGHWLLSHARNHSSAHGPATLSDGEPQPFLQGHRVD